jgi:hypothetical protein
MKKLNASTQFINVLVKVKPTSDPGQYKFETAPAVPFVTQADTIINYQIFDSGEQDIVFTGMTVSPSDNNQLSAATVSISGKQLTFSDANTSPITLSIILNFKDENGLEFMHDPQIQNEPER